MILRGLVIVVCASLLAGCAGPAAESAVNLALHCPYTMDPKPDYALCTDPGDATQLTDGEHVGPGSFWRQTAAVGWSLGGGEYELVVIDLGKTHSFGSVIAHSAARSAAGVRAPHIEVAVSDDGTEFQELAGKCHYVGESPDPNEETRCTATCQASGRGRYVLVAMRARSSFAFADEIEVLSTDVEPPAPTSARIPLKNYRHELVHRDALTVAWATAIDHLEHTVQGLGDRGQPLLDRVVALRDLRAAEAIRTSDAGRIRAEAWKLSGTEGLRLWTSSPWANVTAESDPSGAPPTVVTLRGPAGSISAAVVNLSNAGASDLEVTASVSGAPTGELRLRAAHDVLARTGVLVSDAMPLLGAAKLRIPVGETRQLWLEGKCGKTPASAALSISAGDAAPIDLPIRIAGSEVMLPRDPPIDGCVWAYLSDSGLTRGLEAAAEDDLIAHGVTAYVFPASALPTGHFDSDGNLKGELDFTEHDRQFQYARFARKLIWFFGWNPNAEGPDHGRFGVAWMSPAWRKAFREWLIAWLAHLDRLGVSRDQAYFYPIDEYMGDREIEIAKSIKEIGSDLRVFCVPTVRQDIRNPNQRLTELGGLTDCLVAHRTDFIGRHPELMPTLAQTGKEAWTYQCEGPGKTEPPYTYYRLEWWTALAHNLQGVGFWSYNDVGRSSDDNAWDDCDGIRADYAVVYAARNAPDGVDRSEPLIPSRRWEAWRQGAIDADVLAMLRARAGEAPAGAWRAQAEAVLAKISVVASSDVIDSADEVRGEALSLLERGPSAKP